MTTTSNHAARLLRRARHQITLAEDDLRMVADWAANDARQALRAMRDLGQSDAAERERLAARFDRSKSFEEGLRRILAGN